MPTEFGYRSLTAADAIRLLLLQPRAISSNDEIHCKLQHVTLRECEDDLTFQYVALSYVWGSEEEQRIIFVDGTEFHVTVNLFNALRSIRHESKELPLWVDAVCIDQNNTRERSQQVRFMGSIYASAGNTIIYLGESDEDSDRAIRALNYMENADDCPLGFPDYESLENCIVSSILSRPWFTRVWVLQELALSQNPIVQCGLSRVRWGKLPSFLLSIEEVANKSSSIDNSHLSEIEQLVMDMQEAREQTQIGNVSSKPVKKHQNLFDLVRWRSGLGAKDPRDIIYAHIGMVNFISADRVHAKARSRPEKLLKTETKRWDGEKQNSHTVNAVSAEASRQLSAEVEGQSDWVGQDIAIDYEKPVAEVYNDFARVSIERIDVGPRLRNHILNLSVVTSHIEATHPQVRMPGLASWAPDWTLRAQHPKFNVNRQVDLLKRLNSAYIFDFEKPILGLLGSVITQIKKTSDIIDWQDSTFPRIADSRFFKEISKIPDSGPVVPEASEERILCFRDIYELWRKRLGHEGLPALVEQKMNDYRISQPDGKSKIDPEKEKHITTALEGLTIPINDSFIPEPSVAEFLVSFSANPQYNTMVQGRRVALLEDGQTALVPASATQGDSLCVINLRPGITILRSCKARDTASIAATLRDKVRSIPRLYGNAATEILYRELVLFFDRLPVRHFTIVGGCLPDKLDLYLKDSENCRMWDHSIIELH